MKTTWTKSAFCFFAIMMNAFTDKSAGARRQSPEVIIVQPPDGVLSSADSIIQEAELQAERQNRPTKIVFLPGVYRLDRGIVVNSHPETITWVSDEDGTVVLDGGNKTSFALRITGKSFKLRGFEIRGFVRDGVLMYKAADVVIRDNKIHDIHSSVWSSGAIHGVESVNSVQVVNNRIWNAGYAAIQFDASPAGEIRAVSIINNTIMNVCNIKDDCGAIYVNGRSPRNEGVSIASNSITDGRLATPSSNGIYIDDGMSGVKIERNFVDFGKLSSVNIHGGTDNYVSRNRLSLTSSTHAITQTFGTVWKPPHWTGNKFIDNRVLNKSGTPRWVTFCGKNAAPFTLHQQGKRFGKDFLCTTPLASGLTL